MPADVTDKAYFGLDKVASLTANVRQKSKHVNSLNVSDLSHHAVKNNVCSRSSDTGTITDT